MSTPKHTPGPWVIHPADEKHPEYSGHVMTTDGYSVADCVLSWSSIERCEQIANARLIAAAPEMLLALQVARHVIEMDIEAAELMRSGPDDEIINDAIANYQKDLDIINNAIKSATGERE